MAEMSQVEGAAPRRTVLDRAELEARQGGAAVLTVYDLSDSRLNAPGGDLLGESCRGQGLVTTQPEAVQAAMLEDRRVLLLRPVARKDAQSFPLSWSGGRQPRINLGLILLEYGIRVPVGRLLDVPAALEHDPEWGPVLALDFGHLQDRPRDIGRSEAAPTPAAP